MSNTLVLPDGREIVRPGWIPDPEVIAEREQVMRGKFFLVKIGGNDGVGEVWRCRGCGGRHRYFTLRCIERPFNGLDQAVYALYQQAGDLAAVRSLDPRQQARRRMAQAIIRPVTDLPDLATMHPQMARSHRVNQWDIEVGGITLGRAEEIPPTLAQKLLDRINALRPIDNRLVIEGLETR